MHTPTKKEWINVVQYKGLVGRYKAYPSTSSHNIHENRSWGGNCTSYNGTGEECVIFRSVRYKKKSNLPPFRKCTIAYIA